VHFSAAANAPANRIVKPTDLAHVTFDRNDVSARKEVLRQRWAMVVEGLDGPLKSPQGVPRQSWCDRPARPARRG
jgi:hypothetical protein